MLIWSTASSYEKILKRNQKREHYLNPTKQLCFYPENAQSTWNAFSENGLGATHHLFLGEIIRVHVDKKGRIDFGKVYPFVYNQGEYRDLHKRLGVHGFSKQSATGK